MCRDTSLKSPHHLPRRLTGLLPYFPGTYILTPESLCSLPLCLDCLFPCFPHTSKASSEVTLARSLLSKHS